MKRLGCLAVLLFACPAWPAEVKLPKSIPGRPGAFVVVTAESATPVGWYAPDVDKDGVPYLSALPPGTLKDPKSTVVMSPVAGKFRLVAFTADDKGAAFAVCVIDLGGPVPPGPQPPGPTPPIPPGPTPPVPPDPGPALIKVPGFAALIVYESKDASKMPAAQQAVLYSKTVRDYLNSKCAPDPTVAAWKAWRIYDKDTAMEGESPVWKDAMTIPRKELPWVILSNSKTGGGYSGPLPKTVEEAMELFKKYGGD